MKKDFSQPFKQSRSVSVYLLIEVKTGFFVQYRPQAANESDFYSVPRFNLDAGIKVNSVTVAHRLARFFYLHGLVLLSYRELERLMTVNFSFIDDTPGDYANEICLHATVDELDTKMQAPEGLEIVLSPLKDLEASLSHSPYFPQTVELGIARLMNERLRPYPSRH